MMNQVSNYEAIRPMFEAFAVNKFHSTGVVQWMYNSAWPTLYWQLFDYYLMPNGAFYGTKKAAAPLLPVYNYGDGAIYMNSDHLEAVNDLMLQVRIYDINSKLLFETTKEWDAAPNSAEKVMDLTLPEGLTTTYFLDLRLTDVDGTLIEDNFYWLSTQPDIPDFKETTWYWTPNKQHADLTGLNGMPMAEVTFDYTIDENEEEIHFKVDAHNKSDRIAFFTEFTLEDASTGEPLLPVFWNDNYISLLPGERRTLTGSADKIGGQDPREWRIVMNGLNLK